MDAAGRRAGRRLVLEHVSELQGVHVVDLKRCAHKKMILLQEESLARLQAVIEFHAKIGCPTRVRDGVSHLRIKAQDMRPCPWSGSLSRLAKRIRSRHRKRAGVC